jgi:uncharacterized protein (TIGR00255 family)
MIQSMTGFGSAAFSLEGAAFQLELRSVNHRHLDARVRLPRVLSILEPDIRTRITARFSRGKFDCSVTTAGDAGPTLRVEIDRDVARRYLEAAAELTSQEGASGTLDVGTLLALPGVASTREPEFSEDLMRGEALVAVDTALDGLAAMRNREGESLQRDLDGRLEHVTSLATSIEGRADTVVAAVQERLRKRSRQLEAETGILDEARLHQEIVLHAERLDITEEVVRLRSHVEQFCSTLAEAGPGQPVGRRLDFLLQELSREANTIGSKGNDAPIAHEVVDLKTELERIREQVQNVE